LIAGINGGDGLKRLRAAARLPYQVGGSAIADVGKKACLLVESLIGAGHCSAAPATA
jgi:hypothetical protein